jgi:hypothetical protein
VFVNYSCISLPTITPDNPEYTALLQAIQKQKKKNYPLPNGIISGKGGEFLSKSNLETNSLLKKDSAL